MRFAVAGVNGRAAAERAASTCHVIRSHQRPSEGHQRSSEVIRGHQRSSEAISGHQWPSARGEHLPRRAPMATLEPRHIRSEARRGREGEPVVTVTVRRACPRIRRRRRGRHETRIGRRRRGRPRQPVGVMETKLIPPRPADSEHPRAYLMREAISMPPKLMSACTQHAISMHSANTQHAFSMHSSCTQHALSMHSSGVPPAAARCRHRSALGR